MHDVKGHMMVDQGCANQAVGQADPFVTNG